MQKNFIQFIKHRFIIPFGKVVHGGLLKSPNNETMVGRKGQRNYFINWLWEPKKNGSFLITGTRGSGKTSFVNHCISEHNINLYSKISKRGTSFKWANYLLHFFILALLAFILTTCVAIISIKNPSLLTRVVLLPLATMPFIGLFYYGSMIRNALEQINDTNNLPELRQRLNEKGAENLYQYDTKVSWLSGAIAARSILIMILSFIVIMFAVINVFSFETLVLPTIPQSIISQINEWAIFTFVLSYLLLSYTIEHKLCKTVLSEPEKTLSTKKLKRRAIYLSQWTVPTIFLRHYVPTISISVNLGFKDLNHTNIIHAMLVDLKSKLSEIFSSRKYIFGKSTSLLVIVIGLLAWSTLSNYLIKEVNFVQNHPVLSTTILSGELVRDSSFSELLFGGKVSESNHFSFSLFDLLLLLVVFCVIYVLLVPRFFKSHSASINRIDDLLTVFSSKVTRTNGINGYLKNPFASISGKREFSTETAPVNSRIVEIEMIKILEEIGEDLQGWFISPGKTHVTPAPSVIFIFDELDKLHNHGGFQESLSSDDKQKSYTEHEAARASQINKLLSDMKNFITTAQAKFIFVAGRDLHDQWLADVNSRESFLTSIFDAELYMPSLLTDQAKLLTGITSNIIKFTYLQHLRATTKFNVSQKKSQRRASLFYSNDQEPNTETYALISDDIKNADFDHLNNTLKLYHGCTDEANEFNQDTIITSTEPQDCASNHPYYKEKFILDFIKFLTYRSQGVPKQLKRLLFEFMRPATVIDQQEDVCSDALLFGDHESFRVQFVANVFTHIDLKIGNYIVQSDDKMSMAVFYLTDFILKFHDYAFSWRQLFRLDELAHIHRLPDLHNIFQTIVHHFTGIYLSKVLNGIYSFRFRSDLSKEITYLSKISNYSSATFNFTLDESGDLKAIYKRKLKENDFKSWDLITGLGELYDLDREFDSARAEYAKAIENLDKLFNLHHSTDGSNSLHDLLTLTVDSQKTINANIKWGTERLGLMLMMGMTYERDNKPVAALAHYRDARTLARILTTAYLGYVKNEDKLTQTVKRLDVLKHFNILYQPLFAEAWMLEKLPGGIDTSLAVLEKGISQLRQHLPFVKNLGENNAQGPTSFAHSNFALITAQFHNKTGDLAFFKGNQNTRIKNTSGVTEKTTGFLMRANYHYAVCLHELRRYTNYRHLSSQEKLGPNRNKPTIDVISKPDYLSLALSSGLKDLGESIFAAADLTNLSIKPSTALIEQTITVDQPQDFADLIDQWLSLSNTDCYNTLKKPLMFKLSRNNTLNDDYIDCGCLHHWLGKWHLKTKDYGKYGTFPDVLQFGVRTKNLPRIIVGLHFSWAGISCLEKAGYYESAAKEYFELCYAVINLINWILIDHKTLKKAKAADSLVKHLLSFAYDCFEKCTVITGNNRHNSLTPGLSQTVKKISHCNELVDPEKITAAYALLLLGHEHSDSSFCGKVNKILVNWGLSSLLEKKEDTPTDKSGVSVLSRSSIKDGLSTHLQYCRYPMLNRLRGLSCLLLDEFRHTQDDETLTDLCSTIIYYSDLYNAPFHFTYLESGLCAFLASESKNNSEPETQKWLTDISRKHLAKSISIHTMGHTYYESITGLYYLYDDFNDRRIHLNQAMQMLASNFTQKLLDEIRLRPGSG